MEENTEVNIYKDTIYTEDLNNLPYVLMKLQTCMRYNTTFSFIQENIATHSFQVAYIILQHYVKYSKLFIDNDESSLNLEKLLSMAILHDASEIISGDLVSNIKYLNNDISNAYDGVEKICIKHLANGNKIFEKKLLEAAGFNTKLDFNNWYFKIIDLHTVLIKSVNELKLNNSHYRRVFVEISNNLIEKFKYFESDDAHELFVKNISIEKIDLINSIKIEIFDLIIKTNYDFNIKGVKNIGIEE